MTHNKISILHLRSSTGSGGGPEKTIFKTGTFINKDLFTYKVIYLTKKTTDLSALTSRAQTADLNYRVIKGNALFDLSELKKLHYIISQEQIDILHSHEPKTDFYAYLLKRFIPELHIVSTTHGWIEGSWKSRLYNLVDQQLLKKFDKVIAVSEYTKNQLNIDPQKVEVVHNAIDLKDWQPQKIYHQDDRIKKEKKASVIGFIGRLSNVKGVFDFIRTAAAITSQHQDCRFLVIGEGSCKKEMQQLSTDLGLQNSIDFLGHVDNNKLPGIYQQLDLLLSPSLSEGLPNTLLEASAMQVPIVATNVGGVSELITHQSNGFLAGVGDVNALKQSCCLLLENRSLAEKIGIKSRHVVEEKFCFKKRTEKLQKIYQSL